MPWKWQQEADMWIEREARKVDPRDYTEEPSIKPTKQELAWLKRLQKVVDSQPPNTCVYVTPGCICLMRLKDDGTMAMIKDTWGNENAGGVNRDYEVGYVMATGWGGGDW